MREHQVRGAKRAKRWRTTTPDPVAVRPRDLVERNFTATRPDALWVADFTYLKSWQGVSTSRSYWTPTAAGSWAGSWPRTRAPAWSWTRCGSRSPAATRRGRGVGTSLRCRLPIHLGRVPAAARRPPRAGLDRVGRRRLRQRDGRELRRHDQDRTRPRSEEHTS